MLNVEMRKIQREWCGPSSLLGGSEVYRSNWKTVRCSSVKLPVGKPHKAAIPLSDTHPPEKLTHVCQETCGNAHNSFVHDCAEQPNGHRWRNGHVNWVLYQSSVPKNGAPDRREAGRRPNSTQQHGRSPDNAARGRQGRLRETWFYLLKVQTEEKRSNAYNWKVYTKVQHT